MHYEKVKKLLKKIQWKNTNVKKYSNKPPKKKKKTKKKKYFSIESNFC